MMSESEMHDRLGGASDGDIRGSFDGMSEEEIKSELDRMWPIEAMTIPDEQNALAEAIYNFIN